MPNQANISSNPNTTTDAFADRTDSGSADLYFHYYGMLQHQQNMLQDYIRTGTYNAAILENSQDFAGKAVMDVGCGSGILSLFAAAAGARVVYAVEASGAAKFASLLATANPSIGSRIKVIHGKVEEIEIPEKVDVLVSEPMGTLLVNERMIESYIYARDKFLKAQGKMFPRLGRIHVSAFSDDMLYQEIATKSSFWQQENFYGLDLTCLAPHATSGYFTQVVVDQIPPNVLVSNCSSITLDFMTIAAEELQEIILPLSLQVAPPCTIHGIACWFDVLFDGSTVQRWLSTAPGMPVTHWFQLRCVLERPIVVGKPGETVSGELVLSAHSRQSYDVHVTLRAPSIVPSLLPNNNGYITSTTISSSTGSSINSNVQESKGSFDLKDPYYRQLNQGWGQQQQQQPSSISIAAEDYTNSNGNGNNIEGAPTNLLGSGCNNAGNGNGNDGYCTTNGNISGDEYPHQQQQQQPTHHENGGAVILTPQSNGVRMMMMGGHEV